jgi:hypothetical protein
VKEANVMNSSRFLPIVGGLLGAMFMIALVLGGSVLLQNSGLRSELKQMREEAEVQKVARMDLVQEREAMREELVDVRGRVRDLERDLEQARVRLAAESGAAGQRRAVRAQVYAGRQQLGESWVIAGGADTNAGVVVTLDERVVRTLVTQVVKQMEAGQGVPREVTVNNNYMTGGYVDSWYPAGWVGWPFPPGGTNQPPSGGAPALPPVNLPASNARSGNVGVWRPTQQPFMPNPSPWPGTTPMRASPQASARVNPALPAQQPVLLP